MSVRLSIAPPFGCSGDVQFGVPMSMPIFVMSDLPTRDRSRIFMPSG
jgi:hypothetical protein